MPSPLLSTYRGGENRVTSSTMAVFERIDLALVQELLEAAGEIGGELRSVVFENQVTEKASVPDARISANFTWWFETKTESGAYSSEGHSRQQLRKHAAVLAENRSAHLFVLTPDPTAPRWFSQLDGIDEALHDQIAWLSFRKLADAIDIVVADASRVLGDRDRFLLTELRALYEADGLLTNDDTVVVAASGAWGEYRAYDAYICQPERSFKTGLSHFGFYYKGQIMTAVPRIISWHPSVLFTLDEANKQDRDGHGVLARVIRSALDAGDRVDGEAYGVMLLSAHDHPDTVYLRAPILNDTTTTTGKPWGWTLSQRYTRLERLLSGATTTSQL